MATSGTVITTASARATVDAPPSVCALMSADTVDRPGPVFVDVTVVQELMRLNDELRQKLAAAQIGPTLSADAVRSGNMELYWRARQTGWEAPEKYHDSGSKLLDGWQDGARLAIHRAKPATLAPTSVALLRALANLNAYELANPFGAASSVRKVLAAWIVDGCPDGRPSPATPPEAT